MDDYRFDISDLNCGDPTCSLCNEHTGPDCVICRDGDDDDRAIHAVPN